MVKTASALESQGLDLENSASPVCWLYNLGEVCSHSVLCDHICK